MNDQQPNSGKIHDRVYKHVEAMTIYYIHYENADFSICSFRVLNSHSVLYVFLNEIGTSQIVPKNPKSV